MLNHETLSEGNSETGGYAQKKAESVQPILEEQTMNADIKSKTTSPSGVERDGLSNDLAEMVAEFRTAMLPFRGLYKSIVTVGALTAFFGLGYKGISLKLTNDSNRRTISKASSLLNPIRTEGELDIYMPDALRDLDETGRIGKLKGKIFLIDFNDNPRHEKGYDQIEIHGSGWAEKKYIGIIDGRSEEISFFKR